MSLRKVRTVPDDCLQQLCKPIQFGTPALQLATDLLDTMYAPSEHFPRGGIGLAAPQVGELVRLIVIDVSESRDRPIIMFNPEVIKFSRNMCETREGCLSIPGATVRLKRHKTVRVRYHDIADDECTLNCSGLLAVCVQHEIDHLSGRLITDG